jgi:hypothetical protein
VMPGIIETSIASFGLYVPHDAPRLPTIFYKSTHFMTVTVRVL